ncbi:tetratricopeptide repeat protein [Shewanella waksmanii]|uniref:tetratricopeptide repeat protein n=1 Tax=Shewanella waksmanii TaxID=213783 RepID=UPI00373639FF
MKLALAQHQQTWQLFSLFLMTVVCYFITLKAPFYLDDASSIYENVHRLGLPLLEVFNLYGLRGVAYASFALNYQVSGLDIAGFHLTNNAIHFFCAAFVYLLTKECCRAKQVSTAWLPFVVALVFVCHPLSSQAVTYIVQRIASLAGLFYFASLYFYLLTRQAHKSKEVLIYGFITGLFILLALFTKQNTVAIFLSIFLLEWLVLGALANKFKLVFVGFLGCLMLAALLVAFSESFQQGVLWLDAYTRETTEITRLAYFETQIRVVGEYIQRLFVPNSLQLEYTTPIADGLFTKVSGYIWLHVALLITAIYCVKKQPLISFGIFFYYTAQIVESSFIPIRDVAFDHRTYIPNFGLILAVVVAIYHAVKRFDIKPFIVVLSAMSIIAVYSSITIKRNALWLDPVAFYQYELAISTNKARVHNALAQLYMESEQWRKASEHFEQAVVLTDEPGMRALYISNYIAAVKNSGELEQAISLTQTYLPLVNSNEARKQLLTNLGFIYIQKREASNAFSAFKNVMTMDNRPPPNEANLGMALSLWALKRQSQAKIYLQRTISNDPENDYARQLLEKLKAQGF